MEWGAAWEIQHPHSKEEIEAKSSITFRNQVLEPRLLAKPTSLRATLSSHLRTKTILAA